MSERWSRRIVVSREWFEQLEQYLQADERCTRSSEMPWPMILDTPYGKRLEFVYERPAKREYSVEEQRKVDLVKGLIERGMKAIAEQEDKMLDEMWGEFTEPPAKEDC